MMLLWMILAACPEPVLPKYDAVTPYAWEAQFLAKTYGDRVAATA